jgi:hypothetical protein
MPHLNEGLDLQALIDDFLTGDIGVKAGVGSQIRRSYHNHVLDQRKMRRFTTSQQTARDQIAD